MQDHTTPRKRNRKPLYPNPTEAFLARITPGSPDECWPWQAGTNRNGYGVFTHQHEYYYAHRVSYEFYHGPIPEGLGVLHSCDNPICCNPYHLRAGTQKDNAFDMVSGGRDRHVTFHGEQHGNSKLKESHIIEIRHLAETGMTQAAIAERFGVCQRTVCIIVNRLTWKHIK
jgi:predicted XRE-type DNA-binding protein